SSTWSPPRRPTSIAPAQAMVPKPAALPKSNTSRINTADQSFGVTSNATAPSAAKPIMTVTGDNLLLGVASAASAFGGGSTGISQRRTATTVANRTKPTVTSWARTLAPPADAADPTTAPPVKPRLH